MTATARAIHRQVTAILLVSVSLLLCVQMDSPPLIAFQVGCLLILLVGLHNRIRDWRRSR